MGSDPPGHRGRRRPLGLNTISGLALTSGQVLVLFLLLLLGVFAIA